MMALGLIYSCQEEASNDKSEANPRKISFFTSDSIQIIGDLYKLDKTATTLLLFHQGGSNARAEYGPIIPRLIKRGFNILAIDQRMGGQTYGNYNRTLAQIPDHSFANPYSYCDAYNNLEAALNYITRSEFTGKTVVWGSSYSASLAIQLAANHPKDISGVLAFSPASGRPMANCLPDVYFDKLTSPLLILRPSSELQNEKAKAQFELATQNGHQTYVAENGVHGSSMLVEERVGTSVEENWSVVSQFLEAIRD